MSYFYIFGTVVSTVASQLLLKWRVGLYRDVSETFASKLQFLFKLLLDPWIIFSLALAFVAALFWMLALTKFQLSFAYPFTSLSFALIVIGSAWIFHEPLSVAKLLSLACITIGLVILARSV